MEFYERISDALSACGVMVVEVGGAWGMVNPSLESLLQKRTTACRGNKFSKIVENPLVTVILLLVHSYRHQLTVTC